MQEIKQFFINIERTDINESMENILTSSFYKPHLFSLKIFLNFVPL